VHIGRKWRWWSIFGGVGVIFGGINAQLATLQPFEPNTCGHGIRWLKDATYRGVVDGAV